MSARTAYGIASVAAKTRLPVPSIRYWAEMYGALIGAERLENGEWKFGEEAVQLLATLAAERRPAARSDGERFERTGTDASNLDARTDAITAKISELTVQTKNLALQVEDLAEETKQLQLLLTRIISLLTPRTRSGQFATGEHAARLYGITGSMQPVAAERPAKTVRPWQPPRA